LTAARGRSKIIVEKKKQFPPPVRSHRGWRDGAQAGEHGAGLVLGWWWGCGCRVRIARVRVRRSWLRCALALLVESRGQPACAARWAGRHLWSGAPGRGRAGEGGGAPSGARLAASRHCGRAVARPRPGGVAGFCAASGRSAATRLLASAAARPRTGTGRLARGGQHTCHTRCCRWSDVHPAGVRRRVRGQRARVVISGGPGAGHKVMTRMNWAG
jgi:hypothetical protein